MNLARSVVAAACREYIPILFCTVALGLAGCNNSGDGESAVSADTSPPTVISASPASDAAGVVLNATVSATFSEAMDCATLTGLTFSLSDGAAVAGNVTCGGDIATFTPSANLTASTTYTATITTAARDAASNALAANFSWSFTTGGIRAWGTPTLLETETGAAGAPAVAADRLTSGGSGDGTAVAVWAQDNSIYASRYTGSWSSRQLIGNDVSGGGLSATGPRIAMGDVGQAIVLWGLANTNVLPPNYSIWSNRYGNSWDTAEQISPLGSGNANSPQLAFDTSGYNVFTLWSQYQYGSTRYNYRTTQRPYYYVPCPNPADLGCIWNPADFGWRSLSMLGLHDIGDASEPQVAAWGTRNAIAVWTQNNITGSVGDEIWAQVATNSDWGALTTAVRVNTGSLYGAAAPMVAADPSGNAVAVWFEWRPARKTLYASRYSANTQSWSAPVQMDDPAGDNASHYGPPRHAVVMDANGNALMVWQQANAGRTEYNILARRCPGGDLTRCEAPVLLENSTGYADLPALALAPNGDAIVVWKQEDGGARRIYARHYSAVANIWSATPSLVGGADSTWNEGPQIAIDGNSNATVVWTEYQSGQYNIFANRYE